MIWANLSKFIKDWVAWLISRTGDLPLYGSKGMLGMTINDNNPGIYQRAEFYE
jgi:hypothetical protein